ETGPVSCAAALAAAQANLENQLTQSGATVTAGPLPVVSAQLPLMTAVFQNLLGNAIKFRGEAPPRVSVTAAQDGTSWVFAVSDNGIGISAEYAERIFVIFQRLHDRATYPGTGIGLAMCRKIIEYFGGRIWLDTDTDTAAEGAGAVFRFTLPVLPEYPSLRSQPELPQVQESHG
ncbi:MAG: ATP-binding protein, partial [Trebonia sp.]|uniref:sensor histidine kinase n=1 Tax=Trebonia sp. TaxID=2767075 RepID=UPI003BAE9F34